MLLFPYIFASSRFFVFLAEELVAAKSGRNFDSPGTRFSTDC